MPKALTPARRGPSPAGQSRSSVLTKNGLAAKSMSGFGSEKLSEAGIWRCSSASTALARLPEPAATPR